MFRQRKCGGEHCLSMGTMDATDLRNELQKIQQDTWAHYDFRTKFATFMHHHDTQTPIQSTHKNTQTIPLYWLSFKWQRDEPIIIYRFMEFSSLFPWIQRLYDRLIENGMKKGVVVKAMFAALLPHQKISPHIDNGDALRMSHRYHWVITTTPSVHIKVNNIEFHMPTDSIYELNNLFLHSVDNPSDDIRIHFIMDVLPNESITTSISYEDIDREKYKQIEYTLY